MLGCLDIEVAGLQYQQTEMSAVGLAYVLLNPNNRANLPPRFVLLCCIA